MKRPLQRRLLGLLFVAAAALLMLAGASAKTADAAVYYLSPTGSDSNPGTSSSPWRTFRFAIPRLQPGDTLLLKNGTYTESNSGLPTINCRSNATNGTASQRITVKAENERQAHLSGDGSDETMIIRNCSYWTIEGLRISSADNPSQTDLGEAIAIYDTSEITLRRNLFHNNNRYCNCHLVFVKNSNRVTVEENEFYYFQRHGINFTGGGGHVARRNYFNSRFHGDVPGGKASNNPAGGDETISFYPSSNNIAENNISENNQFAPAPNSAPSSGPHNNRMLGNIQLNGAFGTGGYSYGNDEAAMSTGHIWENEVLINSEGFGLSVRNARNWTFRNITIYGGGSHAGYVDTWRAPFNCCTPFNSTWENILAVNNRGGFVKDQSVATISWSFNFVNVFSSGTPFNVLAGVSNLRTVNPGLGACRVFIPDSSPMKRAGLDGKDIGANVLYRYENGVLTNQPLWNPITGEFPHGAIVPGVNNIPGSSAFDVHRRLNVNANGCSLPAGYGSGITVDPEPGLPVVSRPSPPRNLQVVR